MSTCILVVDKERREIAHQKRAAGTKSRRKNTDVALVERRKLIEEMRGKSGGRKTVHEEETLMMMEEGREVSKWRRRGMRKGEETERRIAEIEERKKIHREEIEGEIERRPLRVI